MAALGLLRVDHESHGALKLTEAARPVLRGEQAMSMRETVRQAPGGKGALPKRCRSSSRSGGVTKRACSRCRLTSSCRIRRWLGSCVAGLVPRTS